MTWSISAGGTGAEAAEQIESAPFTGHEEERATFEAAQGLLLAQLATISAYRVSASASGYANGCSLSICGVA